MDGYKNWTENEWKTSQYPKKSFETPGELFGRQEDTI